MDLFIVKWEIINNQHIIGFTDVGVSVRVIGFRNYFYKKGRKEYKFIRSNKVAYLERTTDEDRAVYEKDIDMLLKFLSDAQIDYIGWVQISGYEPVSHDIKLTTCKDEYLVSFGKIKNMNNKIQDVPRMKMLSFDIECYAANRGMSDARNPEDKIFMISMIFDDVKYVLALKTDNFVEEEREYTDYRLLLFDDEFDLLETFFNKIKEHDPSIIIGYNIMGFDMKYILHKYYSLLINLPQGGRSTVLKDEIISKSWRSAAYGVVESVIFNFVGRCCFDIYNYLKMEVPMQKYSLDYVSKEILGRNKIDMTYSQMFRKYEEGKIIQIADYCFVDSDLTVKIWKKLHLWYAIVEQVKIFKVHIHELYSSGQQKKIFNQLYYYAHGQNFVFDKCPDFVEDFEYQGATVLSPKKGLYHDVVIVDFASLYPSIIIAENICYTTYEDGAFRKDIEGVVPKILRGLIESRKKIKKMMREEKDDIKRVIYDKRQFAYKVLTNSFYGAYGSRNSHYLQLVDGAKLVTSKGREFLERAMDGFSIKQCEIIYGDTDSCFFVNRSDKDVHSIIKEVNDDFPPPVHVEYEKKIDKLLLLAKKKYIYEENGRIKSKGVITAKRDQCLWVRDVYTEVVSMIMRGEDNKEVNKYIYNDVKNILRGNIRLEKLYINKNLGSNYKAKNYPLNIYSKVLKEAEMRDVPSGERLEYYFIKSCSKYQGFKLASKAMIDKYNLLIDYEYYIDHQLKSPLIQIYESLDWRFF